MTEIRQLIMPYYKAYGVEKELAAFILVYTYKIGVFLV